MSVQPNHAPAALHSWRERRYPPPHPDEKVQKMREAQHGKAGDLPLPSPPIASALDQLDEEGWAVIEDFWSPEQIAQLRLDLADVPSFTPPLGAKGGRGGSSNMIGKTRCLDGLLVDDRIMELCECHLGVAFELSICVLMNIYPGERPQGLHQVRSPPLIENLSSSPWLTTAMNRMMAYGRAWRRGRTGRGCSTSCSPSMTLMTKMGARKRSSPAVRSLCMLR